MILGIVGSEKSKFTEETKYAARAAIGTLLLDYFPSKVVSGGCHLGGIDDWGIELAKASGIETLEFLPSKKTWSGGYRERNIKIAETADIVVCITVRSYHSEYSGMRFKLCYHCGVDSHIKSGGCWTMKYAQKLGKEGRLIVID